MKIFIKNRTLITCSFIAFLTLFLVISCDDDKKESEYDGNIQISLKGIEEYIELDDNTKKTASTNPNSSHPIEIVNYNGFDAITSVNTTIPKQKASNNKEASEPTSIKKLASNTVLGNNIYYRLIFFKANDNAIVSEYLIKANEPPRIRLAHGDYKWIAYSINEATVPTFNNNIVDKDAIKNKDLLYASNTITIGNGDHFLNLIFQRYTTKYVTNIDIRGMFATFHDDTRVTLKNVNGNLYKTANFNILEGEFKGAPETFEITGSELQAIIVGQNDKKTITFHTIAENDVTPKDGLMLQFKPLKIKMDDGTTIRNFTDITVGLKHNAQTSPSTRGRKYTISAQLLESAIKAGASSALWARSNLWYSENNITGAYRFRVSPHQRDLTKNTIANGYISDENDLWSYNTNTPKNENQTIGYDACTSVYPAGLWKMPKNSDFSTLGTSQSLYLADRGDLETGLIVEVLMAEVKVATETRVELVSKWAKSTSSLYDQPYSIPYFSNSPPSTMNDLFLSGIGYRKSNNDITNRPTLTKVINVAALNLIGLSLVDGLVGNGYYWTSDGLLTNQVTPTPTYYTFRINTSELAGVSLLGLNLLSLLTTGSFDGSTSTMSWDNAMNIRCVRNTNYPNTATY